jgi:hypothetical protein
VAGRFQHIVQVSLWELKSSITLPLRNDLP